MQYHHVSEVGLISPFQLAILSRNCASALTDGACNPVIRICLTATPPSSHTVYFGVLFGLRATLTLPCSSGPPVIMGRCMLCVILLSPDNELQTHSRTQKSAVQTHLRVPRMKLQVDQVYESNVDESNNSYLLTRTFLFFC